ncbi:hypothetical protein HN51_050515 [Arachis hypogaea]
MQEPLMACSSWNEIGSPFFFVPLSLSLKAKTHFMMSDVILYCVTIQSSHHKGSFRLFPKAQHHHPIRCWHRSRCRKEVSLSVAHLQLHPRALVQSNADIAIEEASDCFRSLFILLMLCSTILN